MILLITSVQSNNSRTFITSKKFHISFVWYFKYKKQWFSSDNSSQSMWLRSQMSQIRVPDISSSLWWIYLERIYSRGLSAIKIRRKWIFIHPKETFSSSRKFFYLISIESAFGTSTTTFRLQHWSHANSLRSRMLISVVFW